MISDDSGWRIQQGRQEAGFSSIFAKYCGGENKIRRRRCTIYIIRAGKMDVDKGEGVPIDSMRFDLYLRGCNIPKPIGACCRPKGYDIFGRFVSLVFVQSHGMGA